MARTIRIDPKATIAKSQKTTDSIDGYTARLIKYIPGETIVFFVTADRIIQANLPAIKEEMSSPRLAMWLSLGLVLFCLLLTPFYLHKVVKVVNTRQIVVSTIAFLVWSFTVGTPEFNKSLHVSSALWDTIRSLLLPVFTFIAPIFAPIQKNLKNPDSA